MLVKYFNFPLHNVGQTMLMQTIDHTDADFDELHNKLQDLIENKRADCTLIDKQGYSVVSRPIHDT